jgi:hypothetical protein
VRPKIPACLQSTTSHLEIPPEHWAPRGDLFREFYEKKRNASLAAQPDRRTFEDDRADLYWRLHWSSVFEGRRKLKGPIDHLKRKVGRNRCAEFDIWLKRVGIKGSTTSIRYRRLLGTSDRELRNVATSFRYLPSPGCELYAGAIGRVLAQLDKARLDVSELRSLLADVGVLYRQLRNARLEAVRANMPEQRTAQSGRGG